MARYNSPFDNIRVAALCNADWEQMIGNERARFCGQCNLNVYNLSSMTRDEAESFVTSSEGRVCVRFYRRRDGKILTENCPVGLRAMKRRLSKFAQAVTSAVLGFFAGLGVYDGLWSLGEYNPRPTMGDMVQGAMARPSVIVDTSTRVEPPMPHVTMGKMIVKRPLPFDSGTSPQRKPLQ